MSFTQKTVQILIHNIHLQTRHQAWANPGTARVAQLLLQIKMLLYAPVTVLHTYTVIQQKVCMKGTFSCLFVLNR